MKVHFAGFWARFVALIIDDILIVIVYFLLISSLGYAFDDIGAIIGYLLFLTAHFGYFVVFQHKYGQTIGKKAMHIKVIAKNGQTPSMLTLFLREYIGKAISGIILNIGYLWVIWDKWKQALHDVIAGTYVIYVDIGIGEKLPASSSPAAGGASAGKAA